MSENKDKIHQKAYLVIILVIIIRIQHVKIQVIYITSDVVHNMKQIVYKWKTVDYSFVLTSVYIFLVVLPWFFSHFDKSLQGQGIMCQSTLILWKIVNLLD